MVIYAESTWSKLDPEHETWDQRECGCGAPAEYCHMRRSITADPGVAGREYHGPWSTYHCELHSDATGITHLVAS